MWTYTFAYRVRRALVGEELLMYKRAKGFGGSRPSNFCTDERKVEGIVGPIGPKGVPAPKGKPKRAKIKQRAKPPVRNSFNDPVKTAKAEKITKKLDRRMEGVVVVKKA